MKIITSDGVYVQKFDIAVLDSSSLPIPASIFMKTIAKGMLIDDSNRHDFIKFDETEEIEYFKSLDCIVDYSDIQDLTEEELMEAIESILKERTFIAKKYNSMSENERKNNSEMVTQCELLEIKHFSMKYALLVKQGHIPLKLPVDFAAPTSPKKHFQLRSPKIFTKPTDSKKRPKP